MTTIKFDINREIDIICMGRVAVDLYAEQIHSPLQEVETFRKYLGGCAGNIAVGAARLGLKPMMFSCVGKDAMGKFLHQQLIKENVNVDLLYESAQHLTGLVLLGIDPPQHFPLIFYRNDCADMQLIPSFVKKNYFQQAKAFLFTGTGLSTSSMYETTLHAINVARATQTAVIMDLDYRPVLWKLTNKGDGETRYQANDAVSRVYQTILPFCDLLVGTEEEILIASGKENLTEAITVIQSLTASPIVVKQGEKGCIVYLTQTETLTSLAFPVEILNVLGAGDGFMAGLLAGLLKGYSWEKATTYANASGALVVTRHGCAPAIPYLPELDYFIEHYPKDPTIWKSAQLTALHQPQQVDEYEH